MPMCNLTEYSDNHSDTSGSLQQFKRDEIEGDVDLTFNAQYIPKNSLSFKYKSSFITDKNGVMSNFWISSEMPLINCKFKLLFKRYKNCILPIAGTAATSAITGTKLYVPVVTLKLKTVQNYQNY